MDPKGPPYPPAALRPSRVRKYFFFFFFNSRTGRCPDVSLRPPSSPCPSPARPWLPALRAWDTPRLPSSGPRPGEGALRVPGAAGSRSRPPFCPRPGSPPGSAQPVPVPCVSPGLCQEQPFLGFGLFPGSGVQHTWLQPPARPLCPHPILRDVPQPGRLPQAGNLRLEGSEGGRNREFILEASLALF